MAEWGGNRGKPTAVSVANRNRGTALLRGLEFEVRSTLPRGLAIEFAAHAAWGEALDDDAPLADVPPEGAILTLRQAVGARGDLMPRAWTFGRRHAPFHILRHLPDPAHPAWDKMKPSHWSWSAVVRSP